MRAAAEVTRRRLAPFEPRGSVSSWYATGFVVLVAAVLRFAGLAQPQGKLFDETYYAKDGWGLLTKGVEWNYRDGAPAFVVHPPLGKWLIALGEWSFGYYDVDGNQHLTGHLIDAAPEFGWRFSAAVAGTVSVLLMVRIARRLFGSTVLGCAAGLLLALDGFHLVLSRVAMLDIFLLLFVLASFGALLVDRDHRRRAWLDAVAAGAAAPTGVRWWRLFAALLFGCALATKWSALFFLPVFAALVLWWEAGARRSAGVRRPWQETFRQEIGWLALCGVVIVAVYLASWSGWLLTDDGYFRHWRAENGQSELPVIGALQNLVHYHQQAFGFHSTLQDKHPSQSWPWQWLLLGKPVTVHLAYPGAPWGQAPVSEIILLGTPLLWWSFLPALVGDRLARHRPPGLATRRDPADGGGRAAAVVLLRPRRAPGDVQLLHRARSCRSWCSRWSMCSVPRSGRRARPTPTADWSAPSPRVRTWCSWCSASRTSTSSSSATSFPTPTGPAACGSATAGIPNCRIQGGEYPQPSPATTRVVGDRPATRDGRDRGGCEDGGFLA